MTEPGPAGRGGSPGVHAAGPPVHVVLPGDVDDRRLPSGGNVYGLRVCAGLPAAGRAVHAHRIGGTWPRPAAPARRALARCLEALPAGADVLLDGLVACGVPEAVVPAAARLRLTVLVHLPLGDESGLDPAVAAALSTREGRVLRAARAVVATSPHTARRVRDLHGVAAHVVAPGVDAAAPTQPSEAGSRLLCVGSITPTKGQDVLVRALARIADREWTCALVGPTERDPEHVERVRGLVQCHDLGRRVRLDGPRTGVDLDASYAAADLLVVPSRRETYGMVVTEALARATPVVAAGVDGLPETVRGDGTGRGDLPGLLVAPDPDMADALAAALRRWLDEPALRADARAAARRRRPRLAGWDVTARRLTEVLA
ncbi:MAG: glycosyltransferase family 4 protein [Pseudonocardia sp.]